MVNGKVKYIDPYGGGRVGMFAITGVLTRGIIRSVLFAAKTVIFGFFGLLKENLFTNFGIF